LNPLDPINAGFAGIDEVPAPWSLTGSGLIVFMRSKLEKLQADASIPADIRDSLNASLSVLMYVDYTHSNAGPYKELLYVPGTALFGTQRRLTISNIVVSSASSVMNGRKNWGIPKNLCEFETLVGPEGLQDISLAQDGFPQFQLAYTGKGFTFPITTSIVPGFMKTLSQRWEGKQFTYSPSATGRARLAKVHLLESHGSAFPELDLTEVLFAVEVTRFNMVFPVPEILDFNS
jgi:hypothetical protein